MSGERAESDRRFQFEGESKTTVNATFTRPSQLPKPSGGRTGSDRALGFCTQGASKRDAGFDSESGSARYELGTTRDGVDSRNKWQDACLSVDGPAGRSCERRRGGMREREWGS